MSGAKICFWHFFCGFFVNLIKKSLTTRFGGDKFIYRINDFYENKSMEHIIFSNTHGRKSKTATAEENTQKLKNVLLTFLDKLNDVNGYCKYMYLIDDKKYIRKLVEEGQKPIVTGCDVVRYMKLAEEYWMIKYNKINEMM